MDTSCAERVYEHVRAGILDRRFADNEMLAEGRIAEEAGVSRTPVREALLRLQSEGMVQLLPKRGALVLPVTAQEAGDLLATRELVEIHCAEQVIEQGRGADVAVDLDRAMGHMQAAAMAGDVTGYVRADREFHAAIVDSAGNRILSRLYGTLRDRQLRMGTTNLMSSSGRPETERLAETMAEHRFIARAIADGDRDSVRPLITAHLATAERYLRR
jgi:DNA-binding GntR family transcriptional regulator